MQVYLSNIKKLPDPCKSKWNSSKGGRFLASKINKAAILKSTYQKGADQTTSFATFSN